MRASRAKRLGGTPLQSLCHNLASVITQRNEAELELLPSGRCKNSGLWPLTTEPDQRTGGGGRGVGVGGVCAVLVQLREIPSFRQDSHTSSQLQPGTADTKSKAPLC